MTAPVAPDLLWLAASCTMTALLWIPYVANRFKELGPPGWRWFPEPDPPPRARWAERAMRAHANAVENLVVFAPLALAAHAVLPGQPMLLAANQLYFAARAAHYLVCILGLPIVPRTIAFLAGVAAQLALAAGLLGGVAG